MLFVVLAVTPGSALRLFGSDFGEGAIGNMGPHVQDLLFWALKVRTR